MLVSKTIAVLTCASFTALAAGLAGCSGAVAPDPLKTGTEGQALEHHDSDVPPLPSPAETAAYRARLGIPAEAFLFGVLGFLRESKRLFSVLNAFAETRSHALDFPPAPAVSIASAVGQFCGGVKIQ